MKERHNVEDFLAHYGILGMRWGIRRFQPYPKGDGPKGKFVGNKQTTKNRAKINAQSRNKQNNQSRQNRSNNSKSNRKSVSYDHLKSRQLEKQKIESLSNRELQDLTRRLDLEKKYRDLSPKQKSKGRKIVNDMLTTGITRAGSKIIENRILEFTGDKPKYKQNTPPPRRRPKKK